jgi:hypothetical protein
MLPGWTLILFSRLETAAGATLLMDTSMLSFGTAARRAASADHISKQNTCCKALLSCNLKSPNNNKMERNDHKASAPVPAPRKLEWVL